MQHIPTSGIPYPALSYHQLNPYEKEYCCDEDNRQSIDRMHGITYCVSMRESATQSCFQTVQVLLHEWEVIITGILRWKFHCVQDLYRYTVWHRVRFCLFYQAVNCWNICVFFNVENRDFVFRDLLNDLCNVCCTWLTFWICLLYTSDAADE